MNTKFVGPYANIKACSFCCCWTYNPSSPMSSKGVTDELLKDLKEVFQIVYDAQERTPLGRRRNPFASTINERELRTELYMVYIGLTTSFGITPYNRYDICCQCYSVIEKQLRGFKDEYFPPEIKEPDIV